MNVLHLCPLWYPVAIDAAGGIETFIAQLVHALARHGCRSTLIASGDSRCSAALIPAIEANAKDMAQRGLAWQYEFYEQHQLALALARAADASQFDVVHSHIGPAGFVLSDVPGLRERVVHTVHSPVYRDMEWYVSHHPQLRLITVSEHQARKLRDAGALECQVAHNGIDFASYDCTAEADGDLVFVGRIEWGKGPELAVQAARRLGRRLNLAGPILDQALFDRAIAPFLGDQIRYLGVIDHATKNRLFGEAGCAVLPFRRDEPFGMVAIEAMACGTPVVAFADGALPEIIEPGVTGFLAPLDAALDPCIERALTLDRTRVRDTARARFDIDAAAQRHLQIYRQFGGNPALRRREQAGEARV